MAVKLMTIDPLTVSTEARLYWNEGPIRIIRAESPETASLRFESDGITAVGLSGDHPGRREDWADLLSHSPVLVGQTSRLVFQAQNRREEIALTSRSAFPTKFVDRSDVNYRNVPWHHLILIPKKGGSSLQDFIRRAEDLQSAMEIKYLEEIAPHYDAHGRELTLDYLKDEATQLIARNDPEWLSGCKGLSIIHHPSKAEKLSLALANLVESPRGAGRQKLLSVRHEGQSYSLEIQLLPNVHMRQDGLIFGLVNPEDPANFRLIEEDRGQILNFSELYNDKELMEHFALYSLCHDVVNRFGIPLEDMHWDYEPLGESTYPDFGGTIAGQEWGVEVVRVEADMTAYVEVERQLDQKGLNRVFKKHITDDRVRETLNQEIGDKGGIRSKCLSYSRHCLVLVDIVDAVGDKDSDVWEKRDLSSFDAVVVVKMDGTVHHIKGEFPYSKDE